MSSSAVGTSTDAAQRQLRVDFPAEQSYTSSCLRRVAARVLDPALWTITEDPTAAADVQWSDYDAIDWDAADRDPKSHLVNSYAIRKALIRKNHLGNTIRMYCAKRPESALRSAFPRTYMFNLAYADELDELLQDDLYDVAESFEKSDQSWWLIKPALADKGMGIRLFHSREELEAIVEAFELEDEDEDEDDGGDGDGTAVNMSQMREWIVQEYESRPLLLSLASGELARKFHLRVYVLAVGALKVYVHTPFLALFADAPYSFPPAVQDGEELDLAPHLTNTCLQGDVPMHDNVRPWQGLEGATVTSEHRQGAALSAEDVRTVEDSVAETVSETFRAALSAGSTFQPLPNAFEIFGVDVLVREDLSTVLLEVNACPDFKQTGPELVSVVEELFASTLRLAVIPFFDSDASASETSLREVLSTDLNFAAPGRQA